MPAPAQHRTRQAQERTLGQLADTPYAIRCLLHRRLYRLSLALTSRDSTRAGKSPCGTVNNSFEVATQSSTQVLFTRARLPYFDTSCNTCNEGATMRSAKHPARIRA